MTITFMGSAGSSILRILPRSAPTIRIELHRRGFLVELKTIATGGGATGDEQYHGTSSWHLAQAFPGVEFPASSFPVRDNPADIEAVKERLLR